MQDLQLQNLQRIGLTAGERSIYEALLTLGETTRTQLAKRSGISPSKIYDVTNRLIEKGIVSSVRKNGVLHFRAAHPERLRDYIEQKEAELQQERAIISQLLPQLVAAYEEDAKEQDVEVFSGWRGMQTVYDDIIKRLEKGDENRVYGASSGHDSEQADIFFARHYRKKQRKGFGTRIIFNESVRHNTARTEPFRHPPNAMRFLDQETFAEINTYKDVVLIVLLLRQPLVIRITNQEAADSFTQFFRMLWQQARP